MTDWKPWLAAAMVQAVMPLAAQADPMAMGRQMADAFLRGDTAAIWAASTPEMQKALGSPEALAAFRDGLMADNGTVDEVLSERVDDAGGQAVFISLSRWTTAPTLLETVIAFDKDQRIAGFFIRPQPLAAPTDKLDYTTKADLRLPFTGDWFVFWGGREIEDNYHAANPGQRFALDLVVRRDGQTHAGDAAALDNYYCWGQPILSPAKGTVVGAVDGLPDQAIGTMDAANPAGNHVVIDLGNGEYGFLAHMQKGSLRVQPGDAVTPGQPLGLCGNSGNTSEPHLHFHLQTSPTLGSGVGLPAQFNGYQADGAPVARGEPRRGQVIRPAD